VPGLVAGVIYVLFFLSGAAALMYQVVWVRSLTLVFGGSHLAVTAVLSIFMAGLALGGYAFGRRADRARRPLRLYGLLELGVAAFALVFAGLMKVYPAIYIALAGGRDADTFYLTFVRLLFAAVALIVPTTLMGGTLPVISRVVSRQPETLRRHLSFLYGVNTLGAVLGAGLAGFVLLRLYSVSATLLVAVAVNALIGLVCLALPEAGAAAVPEGAARAVPAERSSPEGEARGESLASADLLPLRLVLWGIGVSGFCALGYEVLWTRVLTIAVGASVYGFTIILVAFLTGIALGSAAYGALVRARRGASPGPRQVAAWFGATQVIIGVTALLATVYLRDIPTNTVRLQNYFLGAGAVSFSARVWANFLLAVLYMAVPALFMGAAFPIAGEALALRRRAVGRAVGDVLGTNTVGAILGASVSGLLMIRWFGIEASLEMLTALNAGLGLVVLASLRKPRWLTAGAALLTLGAVAGLSADPGAARLWDRKYFAIFRSNQPEAFATPAMVREAVENTDVLYYAEGVESIVSVIRVKGGQQAFITNGRVEASSHLQAQQVQYTLGYLPALLARNPKDVLVVGLGSGMTAGATAVVPSVEHVTIAEIEPKVLGVARTFAAYNHGVLDNPKVRVVINDGRNFLMTTQQQFDVITADPIHPWFQGAGYLYASEYFALAAAHLRPGGVIAQWLPIYELTPRDLASVVRTFQRHFPHTMMWLEHYDAVIVGSATPFRIDEAELDRRIADPVIADDLRRVDMGSATDLLSYFVMGTEGMQRFGRDGVLNTDDRLYLEFSAPFSIATPAVMALNVNAIAALRGSILPCLKPEADLAAQRERWTAQLAAGRQGDRALAMFLAGEARDPQFEPMMRRLNLEYPWYAPGKFLWTQYQDAMALEPRLLQQLPLTLAGEDGATVVADMAAVLVPVSPTRASIMFVDNRARVVYGQLYVDNYDRSDFPGRFALEVMGAVRAAYESEAIAARSRQQVLPPAAETLRHIKEVIVSKVQSAQPGS
jgi:spermidine synthase